MIGYNSGDEFGADGWWEEGETSEELSEKAAKVAADSGFDSAPDLVEVKTSELSTLSDDQWDDLFHQWKLSRRNRWTSEAVDAAITTENERRNA